MLAREKEKTVRGALHEQEEGKGPLGQRKKDRAAEGPVRKKDRHAGQEATGGKPLKEEQQPLALWKRIGIGLFFPFCAALALFYARYGKDSGLCLFYRLTGLYCPGCGSGRAIGGLLRGQPLKWVFSCNVLLFPLGIPALLVGIHEYLRVVFPALKLRPVYVSQRTLKILIGILLGFWILRNLPMFAFLAPPVLPH